MKTMLGNASHAAAYTAALAASQVVVNRANAAFSAAGEAERAALAAATSPSERDAALVAGDAAWDEYTAQMKIASRAMRDAYNAALAAQTN